MKKIHFVKDVLPHIVAVACFLLVTLFFFKPAFFDNKTLQQPDIQQFQGTAKSIQDFREETGEEALWAESIFSGMPAYLVSVAWSNEPVRVIKSILTLGLPHPINNIFLSFIAYYIMLLAFRVRPYLAIAGAFAFGLSSYMIIGLAAGHNARIGAIACMPLVMAGIHLAFTNRKLLGIGVTAAGLALHFRDNHIQITYYMLMIAVVYGLIRLVEAIREKTLPDFLGTTGALVVASLIGFGTYAGPFWAITEYAAYSIRGKSDLVAADAAVTNKDALGISKTYAFAYSNGILEPMTLLIPNFYGGSTAKSVLEDRESQTFRAMQNVANQGNQQALNQLYPYTIGYWGPQMSTAPYYAGAIVVFLFALGIGFAERRYVVWIVPLFILSILLSWGSSFESFNYFLFDYLPGYNKFRSVTFAIIIALFLMPLLGMLGLERVIDIAHDKKVRRKILVAFAATGGLCLLLWMFAGVLGFMREEESTLPPWFIDALAADRKSMFRSDAFRSFAFILSIAILIYFQFYKRISAAGFFAFLAFMTMIDVAVVSRRYFPETSYRRKTDRTYFAMTQADQAILNDKGHYRVYNLDPRNPYGTFTEAKTAYYHHSIGGYHGAKLRRYQEYIDSCFVGEVQKFAGLIQSGSSDLSSLGGLNMLNVKYIAIGENAQNIIRNDAALGNAWFVREVVRVNSAAEELARVCDLDTRTAAVIDVSRFEVPGITGDTAATITLDESTPRYLKYTSNSAAGGIAVFSEIYYPKGWVATIDGKEAPILRANYILRALHVPAGRHTIEFRFEPKAYTVGNTITMASSWLVVLVLLGSILLSLRNEKPREVKV